MYYFKYSKVMYGNDAKLLMFLMWNNGIYLINKTISLFMFVGGVGQPFYFQIYYSNEIMLKKPNEIHVHIFLSFYSVCTCFVFVFGDCVSVAILQTWLFRMEGWNVNMDTS